MKVVMMYGYTYLASVLVPQDVFRCVYLYLSDKCLLRAPERSLPPARPAGVRLDNFPFGLTQARDPSSLILMNSRRSEVEFHHGKLLPWNIASTENKHN